MQGKKDYQEKLFIRFQLSDYVPADNFYRRLKSILDLRRTDLEFVNVEAIPEENNIQDIMYIPDCQYVAYHISVFITNNFHSSKRLKTEKAYISCDVSL
jgi:hypothetical protein